MAHLAFAAGSSHGPTLQSPPEDWARLGEGDTRDPRYDFQEVLRNAPPNMAEQITIERMRERDRAAQAGLSSLADRFQRAKLDVVVVVSNPHRIWAEDNQPVFGVYRGATVPVKERGSERFDPDDRFRARAEQSAPAELKEYLAHPELANHLINSLIEQSFDVASTVQLRENTALDDAFSFLYERFYPSGGVAMVPFMVSRYLPYQATPARCYALGGALRQAIESWESDSRVGLLASGGLSHQIIDEELDHRVIDALVGQDQAALCSLSRDRLNGAPGTPEILNWITLAGAMQPTGMTLIDYVPCYRSLAGTGHGITFGYWE